MLTLTLLHTNDLHAHFEAMTRLATLIQRERAQAHLESRPVLLLDAGDSASTRVWESDVTQGRANYVLLEAMGYDAAVIGNSDSQWGYAALTRLLTTVHFPLLAANLRGTDSAQMPTGLRAYHLVRFESLTVAVIGLTTHEETEPYLSFADPAETLRGLLAQLQPEGAQLIIVLSHLGIDTDRQLAASIPGLHLIIGGHTHTTLAQPEFVGPTAIVQTGEFGHHLGRVDLEFDPPSGNIRLLNYQLIPCSDQVPPDPTVSGMLELVQFEADVLKRKASGSQIAE